MASPLTHAVVGVALAQVASPELRKEFRFWAAVLVGSILPDIDVVGFSMGIRYSDLWGHRGMTHSIVFAAITGIAVGLIFVAPSIEQLKRMFLFFFITLSHGILDAMTNGGLGVAFFSPFKTERYFFRWRPIEVSPLSSSRFFSERGLAVLLNEMFWVWIPALCLGALLYAVSARKFRRENATQA
jgi:inner membrane protein